ncbi:hypothetical protein A2U01_0068954, partial [Trifolium medium]|nr:hypothetical protein [Trifolium medium]
MTRTNSDKLDELTALVTQFKESFDSKMDAVNQRVESLERRSPESGNSHINTDANHTRDHYTTAKLAFA